jgi:peptide-methionine (S)-S-oxide reductase
MHAIFAATPEQEAIARGKDRNVPILTGARFFLAEDYHQKYYLRHDTTLMRELAGYTARELVDSTVAARLNGVAAGHVCPQPLGLSAPATAYLGKRAAHSVR